ncbi:hypothetical protein EVA_06156 [gut metagenome]|uniref:Uncharacterized protein n=1 Tax=gut metagenome TaxID=749906 RepID=J9CZP6_9ZZZZ
MSLPRSSGHNHRTDSITCRTHSTFSQQILLEVFLQGILAILLHHSLHTGFHASLPKAAGRVQVHLQHKRERLTCNVTSLVAVTKIRFALLFYQILVSDQIKQLLILLYRICAFIHGISSIEYRFIRLHVRNTEIPSAYLSDRMSKSSPGTTAKSGKFLGISLPRIRRISNPGITLLSCLCFIKRSKSIFNLLELSI